MENKRGTWRVGEKRQNVALQVKESQGGMKGCRSQREMRRDTQRILMQDHNAPTTMAGMSRWEGVQTMVLLDSAYFF